jgi:hypothetical protein
MALNKQKRELISSLQESTTGPNDIWRGTYAYDKTTGGEMNESEAV